MPPPTIATVSAMPTMRSSGTAPRLKIAIARGPNSVTTTATAPTSTDHKRALPGTIPASALAAITLLSAIQAKLVIRRRNEIASAPRSPNGCRSRTMVGRPKRGPRRASS